MVTRKRKKFTGFTLIELLVVISIIALLMAVLMPALARVRKQAQKVLCQTNLHQWGLIWSMYTNAHDGSFHEGWRCHQEETFWEGAIRPYYQDNNDLRLCPLATQPMSEVGIGKNPFVAWGKANWPGQVLIYGRYNDTGSYCINEFVCNPRAGTPELPVGGKLAWNWRNTNVKGTEYIPVFGGGWWNHARPQGSDDPPEYDGHIVGGGYEGLNIFCVNRHDGYTNMLFMDWSVRDVGLKELWELRWHRDWTRERTTAGLPVWPNWMKSFRDYAN